VATKSDIQLVSRNWATRVQQYNQAGIPTSVWRPLLQRDMRAVVAGHAPLGDREVNDAIYAGSGHPIITDPHKGHGLFDVLGNIPSDVQNLVTGFVPGIAGYVHSLPEQMGQVKALAGFSGPEAYRKAQQETGIDYSQTDLGGILRNMSRTPVFNFFVPGLQTAANLTTTQGREQILEHPVSTAIDVGALVSLAGEAGVFGRSAGAAEQAARTVLKEPEYGTMLNTATTSPYLKESVFSHPSVNLPENAPLVEPPGPVELGKTQTPRYTDVGRQYAPAILKRLNEHIPELKHQIETTTEPIAKGALQANYNDLRIARSAVRKLNFVDEKLPMVTTPTGELTAPPEAKMSALSALQQGKGFKAAGRVALRGTELGTLGKVNRAGLRQFFLDMGVHPDIVNRLSRPYAEIRNRNIAEMNAFLASDVVAPLLKLPEDAPERVLFNRVVGGQTHLTDEEIAMLQGEGQLVREETGGLPTWPELTDIHGNPVGPPAPATATTDVLSRAMPEAPTVATTGRYVLTDEGQRLLTDPATDEALRTALQKVQDNADFQTAVIPGTDISLRVMADRATTYMKQLARENPNLVEVSDVIRNQWQDPWGREYFYHQSHPVAQAWKAQLKAFAEVEAARQVVEQTLARRNEIRSLGMGDVISVEESYRGAVQRLNEALAKADAAKNKYYKEFNSRAPAAFYGVLGEATRERGKYFARENPALIQQLETEISRREQGINDIETGRLDLGDRGPVRKLELEQQVRELNAQLAKIPRIPVQEAINRVMGASDTADLAAAIGPEQATQLMTDVEATWRSLAARGVDPIFLPNVKPSRVEHVHIPTVLSGSTAAPAHMGKNTAFNLSRSVYDVAVGLAETQRQALTEAGTREFATRFVQPLTRDSTSARNEIQGGIRNGGPTTADIRHQAEIEMDRHYVRWNAKDHAAARALAAYFPSIEGGDLLLPKGVADALERLGREENAWRNPLRAKYDKVMKVWRFSVLTTPRHMSHVINGGMMMGLLRDPFMPVQLLTHFREALAIMRGDDYVLKARFGGNINDFEATQLANLGGGKSIGRIAKWLQDNHPAASQVYNKVGPGALVRGVNHLEDSATQMYKITQMLAEEKFLAKQWDVPVSLVRDEAISRANKMFVDMNAMSPFERTTIRKIFPFYGFTRHLFRYLMTYPADHPMTAAILTNFALQHEEDWGSGLPRDFSFMFFLGEPDSNGMVNAVDYRSIDPFRSFYNVFTLAGVTSQMNPGFQLLATQAGVNVLSATSELYPHTHYNPTTGQMEADQPPNLPLRLLETIIPPTQAIDAKFALSDQFRNLKISDPEGFKNRLYTSLGIPFSGFPFSLAQGEIGTTINKPRKVETAQLKRFTDASNAINEAIRTGDFTNAERYDTVPVPTMMQPYLPVPYASPQSIEAVYRGLQQRYGVAGTDISLHAVLPKPTRRRTR
jgi:hypothetical protein